MQIDCTDQICDFFDCAVNQILYLRHVYPSEDFSNTNRYGLVLLKAMNSDLQSYLERLMVQIRQWVAQRMLSMLVVVITDTETGQVYERWSFCVDDRRENQSAVKSEPSVVAQIQTVMKQIVSSVSFLPQLPDTTTFNVLAYTDREATVPATWSDSDPRIIKNAQVVKLTPVQVNDQSVLQPMVAYRILE